MCVRTWVVALSHTWVSATGCNGRPLLDSDVRVPFPHCSGRSISFAQIRNAKHYCSPSRFVPLATTSITHSKQLSATPFALMAPQPSYWPPDGKAVPATHRLLTSRLSWSHIGFWVVHPGGRKVIDNVQKHFGMTDAQLCFSRTVLRNYGNMSSPTVMFVLDEVVRSGDPRPGDWGVMIGLGPGMAAEVALLRW